MAIAVEMLGFAMLAAAAWIRVGLWAALLVSGVALVLTANFTDLPTVKLKRPRLPGGPLTNARVDDQEPEAITTGS